VGKLACRIDIAGRALLATRPGLAVFLSGLPYLNLSDTGRRNVARRFALTDAELAAARAVAAGPHGPPARSAPDPTFDNTIKRKPHGHRL